MKKELSYSILLWKVRNPVQKCRLQVHGTPGIVPWMWAFRNAIFKPPSRRVKATRFVSACCRRSYFFPRWPQSRTEGVQPWLSREVERESKRNGELICHNSHLSSTTLHRHSTTTPTSFALLVRSRWLRQAGYTHTSKNTRARQSYRWYVLINCLFKEKN